MKDLDVASETSGQLSDLLRILQMIQDNDVKSLSVTLNNDKTLSFDLEDYTTLRETLKFLEDKLRNLAKQHLAAIKLTELE